MKTNNLVLLIWFHRIIPQIAMKTCRGGGGVGDGGMRELLGTLIAIT